jgi:hypothetical protein
VTITMMNRVLMLTGGAVLCVFCFDPALLRAQVPPPRDVSSQGRQDGAGAVCGQITSALSGRPLPGAAVLLAGGPGGPQAAMKTDRDGRYCFERLPRGAYSVQASKAGYVQRGFQAKGVNRPSLVRVDEEHRATGIDIKLPKGGVITGQVLDENGEAAIGATVRALRRRFGAGGLRLEAWARDDSDDEGRFRLFGLAPGSYYVSVTPGADAPGVDRRPPPQSGSESATPVATYYPSSFNLAQASPVTLETDSERTGVFITVQPAHACRVEGLLTSRLRARIISGIASLAEETKDGPVRVVAETTVRPDEGTFKFENVPPGDYTVTARAQLEGEPLTVYAASPLTLAEGPAHVDLELRAGVAVRGRVNYLRPTAGSGDEPRGLRVVLEPKAGGPRSATPLVGLAEAGTFEIRNVPPGLYLVRVSAPAGWVLLEADLDGRDAADVPFSVTGDSSVSGVIVRLTTRSTDVSGIVESGDFSADRTAVVVYSLDPARWSPLSRWVQVAPPDRDGGFRVRGLPPGDYMAAAVLGVEPGECYDPDVLLRLMGHARRITLVAGQPVTLRLQAVSLQ